MFFLKIQVRLLKSKDVPDQKDGILNTPNSLLYHHFLRHHLTANHMDKINACWQISHVNGS